MLQQISVSSSSSSSCNVAVVMFAPRIRFTDVSRMSQLGKAFVLFPLQKKLAPGDDDDDDAKAQRSRGSGSLAFVSRSTNFVRRVTAASHRGPNVMPFDVCVSHMHRFKNIQDAPLLFPDTFPRVFFFPFKA